MGLFFGFGASDGNPNPIKYSFVTGIGGKGVVPGHPDDSFGIGLARTQFSSDFVPFLRQRLNLGLQHEDAIEMYYNIAVTLAQRYGRPSDHQPRAKEGYQRIWPARTCRYRSRSRCPSSRSVLIRAPGSDATAVEA